MKKEYIKIDKDGIPVFPLYSAVLDDELDEIPENFKIAWAYQYDIDSVRYPVYSFENECWIEGADEVTLLDAAKVDKMNQLRSLCSQQILGYFSVPINGTIYLFSCDQEAQINFEKSDRALEKGRLTHVPWTCYTTEGQVTRVVLDAVTFEQVYIAHLAHIQGSIVRLRDVYQPLVMSAESIAELGGITWDDAIEGTSLSQQSMGMSEI